VIGYDQIASIASGQTSTNISVGDAHVQVVQSGATALGTTVVNGGEQDVFGTASGTVLNGTEVVYGKDSGARIGFFGLQYIYSGGTATGAIVSGGDADQQAYGTAVGTTVLGAGTLFVGAKGSSVNALIGNSGYGLIASGGTGIATTISGSGVMEAVDGGVLDSGTSLTFAGTGGTLQVDDTTMPTAVISGFAPGDTLAFTGLGQIRPPDGSVTGVTLLSGNVLQLTTQDIFFDTAKYFLQLDPLQNFNGDQFEVEIGTDTLGFPGSVEIFVSGPSGPVVSGGTTFVSNGVTSTGAVVESGGVLVVLSGGTALDTTIDSGGSEIVSAGGRDGSAQVAGGEQDCVRHGERRDGVRRIAGGRIRRPREQHDGREWRHARRRERRRRRPDGHPERRHGERQRRRHR
jgi:autotransporter passenger strand-loop-strand repeat protein